MLAYTLVRWKGKEKEAETHHQLRQHQKGHERRLAKATAETATLYDRPTNRLTEKSQGLKKRPLLVTAAADNISHITIQYQCRCNKKTDNPTIEDVLGQKKKKKKNKKKKKEH